MAGVEAGRILVLTNKSKFGSFEIYMSTLAAHFCDDAAAACGKISMAGHLCIIVILSCSLLSFFFFFGTWELYYDALICSF